MENPKKTQGVKSRDTYDVAAEKSLQAKGKEIALNTKYGKNVKND